MTRESALGAISMLAASQLGVFRGRAAVQSGVSRKQLKALCTAGAIERVLPDTYRFTSAPRSDQHDLRAALRWAGDGSAAAGRSAAALYGLEGVRAALPEIAIPRSRRLRSRSVIVHRPESLIPLMLRQHRGLNTTGVEATLIALATALETEAFEIACEDARRRRLTSVPALHASLDRFGSSGRAGIIATRRLLHELDPLHPSRSTLEVKTRRLLVANHISPFRGEFALRWNAKTYQFDFAFPEARVILETNGRHWHDDATDYEHDNEKWSVPGRLGYRIVFATWDKLTKHPGQLVSELTATLAA